MQQENLTPKTPIDLAKTLIAWAQNLNEWNLNDIKSSLDELNYAYLNSALADNLEDRREVIFNHSRIDDFLNEIKDFDNDAFHQLSNLIIKLP